PRRLRRAGPPTGSRTGGPGRLPRRAARRAAAAGSRGARGGPRQRPAAGRAVAAPRARRHAAGRRGRGRARRARLRLRPHVRVPGPRHRPRRRGRRRARRCRDLPRRSGRARAGRRRPGRLSPGGRRATPRPAPVPRVSSGRVANIASLDRVSKGYPSGQLLDAVSLGLDEADRVGVVGRNGAGKSTLLRLLTGAEEPDAGRVTHRRDLRLGVLPQTAQLDPAATVRDVVLGTAWLPAAFAAEHEWAGDAGVRTVLDGLG